MLALLLAFAAGPPGEQWHPPGWKAEAERLTRGFVQSRNAGRLADALRLLDHAAARERAVYGDLHDEAVGSSVSRVMLLQRMGRFTDALSEQEKVARLQAGMHGAASWQASGARLELAHCRRLAALEGDERRDAHRAEEALRAAENLQNVEEWKAALPAARAALDRWEALVKPPHPRLALALFTLGSAHHGLNEPKRAVPLLGRAAAMWERLLGRRCPEVAQCLELIGEAYHDADDLGRAEKAYRQTLAVLEACHGKDSFPTAAALSNLSHLMGDLNRRAEARRLMERAFAITERSKGERHPASLQRMNSLAMMESRHGDMARGLALMERVVSLAGGLYHAGHPTRALYLNNLGMMLSGRDEFARARPMLEEALAIRRRALGDTHPWTTSTMNNLALALQYQGHFPEALRLLLAVREAEEASLGPWHTDYASTLNNLGRLYADMGEFVRADELVRRAEAIRRKARGPHHPDVLLSMRTRASLLIQFGRPGKALELAAETLRLTERVLGRDDPESLICANQLALAYYKVGDARRAVKLYEAHIPRSEAIRGAGHPEHLTALHNQGLALLGSGDVDRALNVLSRVRHLREKRLLPWHWHYTSTLHAEAKAHLLRGDPENAFRVEGRALRLARAGIEASGALQSERQQMDAAGFLNSHVDLYLTLAETRPASDDVYEAVLPVKGMLVQRQLRQRRTRHAAGPEAAALLRRLEDTDRELARLSLATPEGDDPSALLNSFDRLAARKDELEQALALRGAPPSALLPRPEGIRRALPKGAALLDFYLYERVGRRRGELRLGCFVVRPGRPARFVPLGPALPVHDAAVAWREAITSGKAGPRSGAEAARLVWAPLQKHLAGVTSALVSPDGPLCHLPFAALPGAKADYLIEEMAVLALPVPALLAASGPRPAGGPSLLLLGDVDFGAERPPAGEAATLRRRGLFDAWAALPGTRAEAEAVRRLFNARFPDAALTELTGPRATRAAAAAGLPRHRYLHLATHGFFARADGAGPVRSLPGYSALWHPSLLSGLVLSGANRGDGETGLLTALEVSNLDLSGVELAVLSACETAMGKVQAGEGTLGLQRAFQIAGARATVTSLWSVSDAATALLMEEFYSRLWGKEKLTPAEALRQAQLFVLKSPGTVAEYQGRLLKSLPAAERGRLRGAGKDALPLPPAGKEGPRSPIAWWAAFVLSGDGG